MLLCMYLNEGMSLTEKTLLNSNFLPFLNILASIIFLKGQPLLIWAFNNINYSKFGQNIDLKGLNSYFILNRDVILSCVWDPLRMYIWENICELALKTHAPKVAGNILLAMLIYACIIFKPKLSTWLYVWGNIWYLKQPDIKTPKSKFLPTMAHVDEEHDLRYYHRCPLKQDVSHNNDRNTKVALFLS